MPSTIVFKVVQKLALEWNSYHFSLEERTTTDNIDILFLCDVKNSHIFGRISIKVLLPLEQYLRSSQTELHSIKLTGTITNLKP